MRINVLLSAAMACGLVGGTAWGQAERPAGRGGRPNIVLIMADDLGVGELGCYGQEKIRTPHIDRLAREGMRFTQAYSPSPVCAPTRCGLLTGKHMGHAAVRDNRELKGEGQWPMPDGEVTVAELLKQGGYATACVGKWGLGPVGSEGEPNKQGFDFFYGHNCQRVAHNQYAPHVWRNREKVQLEGNVEKNLVGKHYTPDLMADEAIGWLRENKDRPFFLYFGTPLPHLALQAPAEAVAEYRKVFKEDPPYDGKKGYLPNETPRATYAAMVTRIDDYVGRIVGELKALGLEENTVVIFTSDNGPTFTLGGADSAFFHSTGGLRGLKTEVYEGGIRVPMIVRWPGRVAAGTTSELPTVLYDFLPTATELAGVATPGMTDGVSIVPTLTGKGGQAKHDYLYWEYHSHGSSQAIRRGNWKGVRTGLRKDADAPVQLFDLSKDPSETTDVAAEHPEVAKELLALMKSARAESPVNGWNFEPLPAEPATTRRGPRAAGMNAGE